MSLTSDNILVRFIIALVVYFIFNALITETVTNPNHAKIFRLILLVICLVIMFALQVFVRL